MTIICPTCQGRAVIKNPDNLEETMQCPTCKGKRFVKSNTIPEGYTDITKPFVVEPSNPEGSMISTT